jgi:hypothetical protein
MFIVTRGRCVGWEAYVGWALVKDSSPHSGATGSSDGRMNGRDAARLGRIADPLPITIVRSAREHRAGPLLISGRAT